MKWNLMKRHILSWNNYYLNNLVEVGKYLSFNGNNLLFIKNLYASFFTILSISFINSSNILFITLYLILKAPIFVGAFVFLFGDVKSILYI